MGWRTARAPRPEHESVPDGSVRRQAPRSWMAERRAFARAPRARPLFGDGDRAGEVGRARRDPVVTLGIGGGATTGGAGMLRHWAAWPAVNRPQQAGRPFGDVRIAASPTGSRSTGASATCGPRRGTGTDSPGGTLALRGCRPAGRRPTARNAGPARPAGRVRPLSRRPVPRSDSCRGRARDGGGRLDRRCGEDLVSLARAGSTPRPRSARPRSGSPDGRWRPAGRASRSAAA
jgi:hypothetical protein